MTRSGLVTPSCTAAAVALLLSLSGAAGGATVSGEQSAPPTIREHYKGRYTYEGRCASTWITVDDPDTPVSELVVTAVSSGIGSWEPVGPLRIEIEGTESHRSVSICPINGQDYGVARITFTVSDGASTASDYVDVHWESVDDPATMTSLPDQTTDEDVVVGPLSVTVSDADDPSGSTVWLCRISDERFVEEVRVEIGNEAPSGPSPSSHAPTRRASQLFTLVL